MPPEPVVVFIADVHAGSKLAPMLDCTDADGVNHSPSLIQRTLNDFLGRALADTKALVKGCAVVVALGGDLVDGVAHHGSTQTLGDHNDQRDMAVRQLLPWVNLASRAYGVLGTDAHVGDNGQGDKAVCKELGVPAQGFWRLEVGGKLVDWAHHMTGARKVWLRENAGVALAHKTAIEYALRHERPPDLIVRHHLHQYMHTLAGGVQVVTVPGWQAQTTFTRKLDPNALLTVGVVLYWPKRGEIKPILFDFPAAPIESVSFAKQAKPRHIVTR